MSTCLDVARPLDLVRVSVPDCAAIRYRHTVEIPLPRTPGLGVTRFVPARLSEEGRAEVTAAWRWAKAAPRRDVFAVTKVNLRLVGSLVEDVLKRAESEGKRPTVYASVREELKVRGFEMSKATVQRRTKEAQERGLAPRWVKEEA